MDNSLGLAGLISRWWSLAWTLKVKTLFPTHQLTSMAALFPAIKGSSPWTLWNTNPWKKSSKIHQRNMFLLIPLPPVLSGSMHQGQRPPRGVPGRQLTGYLWARRPGVMRASQVMGSQWELTVLGISWSRHGSDVDECCIALVCLTLRPLSVEAHSAFSGFLPLARQPVSSNTFDHYSTNSCQMTKEQQER